MKEIIETLKTQLPESSIRIKKILEDLIIEIEYVVENFVSLGYLPDKLDSIYKDLQDITEDLKLGYGQMNLLEDIEHEVLDKDARPNYEDYLVDSSIEHTLLENFTHIKPYGFSFLDHTVESKTWKEFYIKACQIFFKLDEGIFLTFANKTHMNGISRNYFAKEKDAIDGPVSISGKIYISTDLGANEYRDLLIKIIKEYNHDVRNFKVYFRADYNPLHRTRLY